MWTPESPSELGLSLVYRDELVTIYHGDNRQFLAECPDGAFNVVHTDPPYNEVNRTSNMEHWAAFDKGGADDLPVNPTELGLACGRIASEWAYVWCGSKQFSRIIEGLESAKCSSRIGGWTKASPVPVNASKHWVSAFELCAIGRKPKAHFNLHAESPILYGERQFDAWHPTEKPLWLVSTYIDAVAHEGATVLDPFMGSGSTLEAAKKAGLASVGIDLNLEYCEKAAERLSINTLF